MSQALTVQNQPVALFHGAIIRGALKLHLAKFEIHPDRLVVYEHSRWLMGFGLLGLLLARLMTGKRLDLEYTKIATVGRGKFGLNKKILDVTMADGTTHRLNIADDKAALIRSQLGSRLAPVEGAEEKWRVVA